jgi:flagellar basal-body rod protein FlgB
VPDDVTSVALHAALRGLAARSRAISDNVANVQTPGFLAGRVAFEDSLREAMASGESPDVAPTIARSLEPTREDGNNVNLDTETISGIDTNLRYQLALRAVDDRFKLMRTAIGGAV